MIPAYSGFLALRYLRTRWVNILGTLGVAVAVWALIVVIAVFFLLTNTAPLLVALSWVHYDRVAGISLACGTVCAVSVFFFRRYPLWLNWIVGLLPMLLLGFALFIDDILL